MKLALLAGVCALSLCADANAAVVYDFVIAPILNGNGTPIPGFNGAVDGRTFTFSISTDESPTVVPGLTNPNYRIKSYSYTEFGSSTPVVVPATLGKNIAFFSVERDQGGISLTNSGNRNFAIYNTDLYDFAAYQAASAIDPSADPIFRLGTSLLSTIPRNGGSRPVDNYTVTITTEAAVPEPATWAMMVGGFGLVGGTLRRRNVKLSFA